MADAQIEWGGTASEDIEDWKELATDILKDSPSIDIVRCGKCKHWCKGDEVYGICYRCPNTRQMRYDDFCSYGEREGE